MQLRNKFQQLKEKNEKALIAYVCAGDPDADMTVDIVKSLVKGGADVVELGLPFSDPVADGPTIQSASHRALDAGMNPDRYFELVKRIDVDVPLVCMTYYNLIYKRGLEKFVSDCKHSGITGIIVPDLPAEESGGLLEQCRNNDVDLIFLISPVTPKNRIKMLLESSSGFIYIISRLGVTGARKEVKNTLKETLSKVDTCLPKAVGFGISNPSQAAEVLEDGADAVIVGSAFVDIIGSGEDILTGLTKLASDIKEVCRPRT